jgi:hypothetical protein
LADRELEEYVADLQKKYLLTSAELLTVLSKSIYRWSSLIMDVERRSSTKENQEERKGISGD